MRSWGRCRPTCSPGRCELRKRRNATERENQASDSRIYVVVFGVVSQFLGSYRRPQQQLVTPETELQAASVSIAGNIGRVDAMRP